MVVTRHALASATPVSSSSISLTVPTNSFRDIILLALATNGTPSADPAGWNLLGSVTTVASAKLYVWWAPVTSAPITGTVTVNLTSSSVNRLAAISYSGADTGVAPTFASLSSTSNTTSIISASQKYPGGFAVSINGRSAASTLSAHGSGDGTWVSSEAYENSGSNSLTLTDGAIGVGSTTTLEATSSASIAYNSMAISLVPTTESATTLNLTGAGTFNQGWNYEGAATYTALNTDDGATTHVYSPNAGDIITYALGNLPPEATSVSSVGVKASTFKLDPVVATTHNVLVINGTVYESTDLVPAGNTTYESLGYSWAKNPATGAAWTVADVNALEIGVKKVNAAGERVSYIAADVVYGTTPTSTLPVSETFTGTNGAAWSSLWAVPSDTTGGTATIQSNAGVLTSPAVAYASAVRNLVGMPVVGNTEVSGTVMADPAGVEQYVGISINNAAPLGDSSGDIMLLLGFEGGTASYLSVYQGSTQVGSSVSKPTLTPGTNYNFRVRRISGTYYARIWTGTEPSTWDFQIPMSSMPNDTAPNGVVALLAQSGGDAVPRAITFDNIQVTDGTVTSATASPALSGSGSLTVGSKANASGGVALSGTGTLTQVGKATVSRAATLSGSGTLSVAGNTSVAGSAVLSGAGTLTATPTPALGASVSFSGSGSVSVSVKPAISNTVGFSGSGTLTKSGTPNEAGTANFTGTGTLNSVTSGGGNAGVSFTGGSALSANGGSPRFAASVNLSGSGVLAITPQVLFAPVAVSLSGAGSLSTLGGSATIVRAAFTGVGALTARKVVLSKYRLVGGGISPYAVMYGSKVVHSIYYGAALVWPGAIPITSDGSGVLNSASDIIDQGGGVFTSQAPLTLNDGTISG